ncbi:response regulator [Lysinibacillus xylanilyticus]|uniref:response regulator n=1 Tax=Lysinibacillus xylanilyticus TaxID=582475 RepID=UPI003D01A416
MGIEQLNSLFNLKPDLVLMDIEMPKLNGLKASEVIGRQQDILIPAVIIALQQAKRTQS